MAKIRIKYISDDAVATFKANLGTFTKLIQENEDKEAVIRELPAPAFIEKKFEIEDFEILANPNSDDYDKDLANHLTLYNALKDLPRYVLCDERFWLWLYLDKFYEETRTMMTVKSESTIGDHWTLRTGVRRGLTFGVLSRMFFRVDLLKDNNYSEDPYHVVKWAIGIDERARHILFRSLSSQKHLGRGIVKGEMRAVNEYGKEYSKIYNEIAKYISRLGSVRLLDSYEESEIEELCYEETLRQLSEYEK